MRDTTAKHRRLTPSRYRSAGGMTLVEVLIAAVLLSFVLSGLLVFLANADKIRGRGKLRARAVLLAQDEAELVRKQGMVLQSITDSSYTQAMGDVELEVTRKVLSPEQDPFSLTNALKTCEVLISVNQKDVANPVVTLRLLQGYYK